MPISVKCAQCGQVSAAPDNMAGRSAKCPKCPAILNIPAAQPAAAQPPQRPAAPAAPALAPFAPPPNSASSLFDEAGMGTRAAGSFPCPSCASSLPANAILCVKCGFNLKTGQQLQTRRDFGAGPAMGTSGDGHADATLILLNRAREAIEESKVDEKKKTTEGVPWWVHLISLLMAIGFLVMMSTLPAPRAMLVAGIILATIGWLGALYTGIKILIIAFEESVLQGVLYLLIPIYQMIYVFTRWDKCGMLFIYNCIAGFIAGIGIIIAIFGPPLFKPSEGQDRSQLYHHSTIVDHTV